jgi:hypothetical protein
MNADIENLGYQTVQVPSPFLRQARSASCVLFQCLFLLIIVSTHPSPTLFTTDSELRFALDKGAVIFHMFEFYELKSSASPFSSLFVPSCRSNFSTMGSSASTIAGKAPVASAAAPATDMAADPIHYAVAHARKRYNLRDPRSPSLAVRRTPMKILGAPSMRNLADLVDPRSPSLNVVRTPIASIRFAAHTAAESADASENSSMPVTPMARLHVVSPSSSRLGAAPSPVSITPSRRTPQSAGRTGLRSGSRLSPLVASSVRRTALLAASNSSPSVSSSPAAVGDKENAAGADAAALKRFSGSISSMSGLRQPLARTMHTNAFQSAPPLV